MKALNLTLTLLLLTTIGCGVHFEKRLYNKGFHVQLGTKKFCGASKSPVHAEDSIRFYSHELSVKKPKEHIVTESDLASIHPIEQKFEPSLPLALVPRNKPKYVESESIKTASKDVLTSKNKIQTSLNHDEEKESGDHLLYLSSLLFVGGSLGMYRAVRKKGKFLTRWASKNRVTTIGIIAALQTGIGYLGYEIGHELNQMGYQVSESTSIIAASVSSLAFLGIMAQERAKTLSTNIVHHYLHKIQQFILCASLLCTGIGVGNGLDSNSATTAQAVLLADQLLQNDTNEVDAQNVKPRSPKKEKPQHVKFSRKSAALIFVYIFLAIVLGLGFTLCSCLAICAWGGVGVLAAVGLTALYTLFNFGMSKAVKKSRDQDRANFAKNPTK